MMSFFKKIFFAFTKRERVAFFTAGIIAAVSFCATLGVVVAQSTTAVPVAGGEYTEGVAGQPEYVNPIMASSETDQDIVKMVYSNVPDIAETITASPDEKTWTVHLKANLHWQDGAQLTSDDVIFTVQNIEDPDAASPLAANWQGITANRVSELEVRFDLPAPYAFFGDNLKNLYIIPKHIFGDVPPGNWRLSDYDLKPIGSGPYQFVSYDRSSDGFISAYRLTAWNGSFAGHPLIPNFTFLFFRNENDLVRSFNSGAVDGFAPTSPTEISSIARPYNLSDWRTTDYYAVFLNQSADQVLQDPAVRNALSLAIDRDSMVSDALAGNGVPDGGPIPPGAAYFSGGAGIPTSSLDLASSTLSAAGWKLNTDGTRAKDLKTTMLPLQMTLTVPDIDFLVKTADIIQDDWRNIGASITIATDSPETMTGGVVDNRAYEALLFGNILGPSSDLYSFWDSAERFSPGLNLATYQNTTVDHLIESARTAADDASRATALAKAQSDIIADMPAIFLYSTDDMYVTNKNVQGIVTNTLSDPSDRFREVPNWYLETTRVLK